MDDVYTWDWFSQRHGYDFHGTWVHDAGGNLAVDPVEPTDEMLGRLVEYRVARIVITNRNHFRAAEKLRAATGARVAVHSADADFVRARGVQVDDDLVPGQRVGPFTVVDAAGKSPGEVALHWPERRLLVVGDVCVGKPPGALALLPAAVIDDLPRLQASLTRIVREIDFDALIVGDGAHILSGARDAMRALVATFT